MVLSTALETGRRRDIAADIARDLGIRAQRPVDAGHLRATAGLDAIGRLTLLDPAHDGGEAVELIGRGAAAAMVHAGHEEAAREATGVAMRDVQAAA